MKIRSLIIFYILVFAFSSPKAEEVEQGLLKTMQQIQQGSFEGAWTNVDSLVNENSKYQLAQLVKAELLAIKSGDKNLLKSVREANKSKIKHLLLEAKVRWASPMLEQHSKLIDDYVLKSNKSPHLIIVSTATNRLFVYENSKKGYKELANYYISIGRKGFGKRYEGDLKTPIGIYNIQQELFDKNLAELYGVGALTLNYPNEWDLQKGRTGSGIWLHGTPRETFSRAPLASRGCVVLNNPAMKSLVSEFGLNQYTPIIIADNKTFYVTPGDGENNNKQQVLLEINNWLRQQEGNNFNWSEVAVFSYPGEQGLYYVSFMIDENGERKQVEKYWNNQLNTAYLPPPLTK